MFSRILSSPKKTAAWRLSIWTTIAFAVGSAFAFFICYYLVSLGCLLYTSKNLLMDRTTGPFFGLCGGANCEPCHSSYGRDQSVNPEQGKPDEPRPRTFLRAHRFGVKITGNGGEQSQDESQHQR